VSDGRGSSARGRGRQARALMGLKVIRERRRVRAEATRRSSASQAIA
jgi:hypothetical protein